ncbi:MAG: hypothetical protein R3F65_25325 [bacterium]
MAVGAALWLYESGLGPGLARRAPVAACLLALPVLALALWVDDLERTALKSGAVLVGLWASALWVEAGAADVAAVGEGVGGGVGGGVRRVAFFYVGLKALLGAVGATGSGAGFLRYLLLGVGGRRGAMRCSCGWGWGRRGWRELQRGLARAGRQRVWPRGRGSSARMAQP